MRLTVVSNIGADVAAIMEDEKSSIGRALRVAVRDVADALKVELRQQVLSAGLGQRVANTWRSTLYPLDGHPSLKPAGLIVSKAPKIIAANETGGEIQSPYGRLLAIPTEEGLRLLGGKRGTAADALARLRRTKVGRGKNRREVVDRGVELEVVPVHNGRFAQAAIVARGVTYGQSGSLRAMTPGRASRGLQEQAVVLFWLVRRVHMQKRLDVAGAAARAQRVFADAVERALEARR